MPRQSSEPPRSFHVAYLLAIFALLVAALPAAAAEPLVLDRYHQVRHLDLRAAEALAWSQCEGRERCFVRAAEDGEAGRRLLVVAEPGVHAALTRTLATHDAEPPTRVFRVLVAGHGDGAELPAAARRALEAEGVPAEGLRLLATTTLRTDRRATARFASSTGEPYHADLRLDAGSAEGEIDVDRLQVIRLAVPGTEVHQQEIADTSFDIGRGETVLAATGSVAPDESSRVVLLTVD